MRYLLLGNARDANLSTSSLADVVVQINGCPYADKIPPDRTRFVFLLNTDLEASPKVIDQLQTHREVLPNATIILARNPAFYTLKKWALLAKNHWHWRDCQLSPAWKRLKGIWPIRTISFFWTLQLEMKMVSLGMPRSFHPSTGLIAYEWILRRMTPEDSLDVAGFTFEGWQQHSWDIEKQIIRPVSAAIGPDDFRRAYTLAPPNPFSKAFMSWCMIIAVLGVFALWSGVKTVLKAGRVRFRKG